MYGSIEWFSRIMRTRKKLVRCKDPEAEVALPGTSPEKLASILSNRAERYGTVCFYGKRTVSSTRPAENIRLLKSVSAEESMNRKMVKTIALGSFALVVVLGAVWQARAQDAKAPYPSMAPIDQYMMDRNAEIAMARSAAPEAISRDAKVMVLGRHGYETAIEGKNGVVCVVERSWMSPFDGPGFWNPK
jgi:hypothetical protein